MRLRLVLFACSLVLVARSAVADDGAKAAPDKIPRIAAADAHRYVSKTCTVELTVRSSRFLAGPGLCLLNSHKNYRDPENFTAVIWAEGRQALKARKIDDPVLFYRGKKIRVTGEIVLYGKRPQIAIEKPEQIEVVKQDKEDTEKPPAQPEQKKEE